MKTWHKEAIVVWGALITALVIFGRWHDWREWIAAVGVGLGFHHASVADRLREAEDARPTTTSDPHRVHCVRWLDRYWIGKEIAWVTYFLAIGAVSALVGCIVFIAHPLWRRWYRKRYPRNRATAVQT